MDIIQTTGFRGESRRPLRNPERAGYRAVAALLVASTISGCMALRPIRSAQWPPKGSDDLGRSPGSALPTPSPHAVPARMESEFTANHPRIEHFVTRFKLRRRESLQDALERSGKYRARLTAILVREGVPTELSCLPLIESGYRTGVVSPAGAAGLWQFTRGTGREYGLRIDRYVDERRDPVKSTHAAARYLRDLHQMFGSWQLSLAAYNVGAQRIAHVLERSEIRTYWDLKGALPQETNDYVPLFLAALHIASAPEAHGFARPDYTPLQYDVVRVERSLSFRLVAQMAGVSVAHIAELNPALVRKVAYFAHRDHSFRDRDQVFRLP